MRLLRNVLVPLLAASLIAVTGCGSPTALETKEVSVIQPLNARTAGDKAVERANNATVFAFYLAAVSRVPVQPKKAPTLPEFVPSDPAPTVSPVVTAASSSYDWQAIANCETGGNWNVTGSVYSTGLGIMNQAIRENSPPDVAARELAGSASVAEITATAESIAAKHGIHSWGCGKKLYP